MIRAGAFDEFGETRTHQFWQAQHLLKTFGPGNQRNQGWNPAKLEQREGRVDRYGREAAGPVNVYFLICRDTYDERVLHVMVNRMRWQSQILLPSRIALHGEYQRH